MALHAESLATVDAAPEDIDASYTKQFLTMHHGMIETGYGHVACTVFTPDKVHVFEVGGIPETPEELEANELSDGWVARLIESAVGHGVVIRALAISRHTPELYNSHTVLVTAAGLGIEYAMVGPLQIPGHSKGMQKDAIDAARIFWGSAWEARCSCGNPFGHGCEDEEA